MMFTEALTMAVIKKQCEYLGQILENMETVSVIDLEDAQYYQRRIEEVADNLKKMRKLQKNYRRFGGYRPGRDHGGEFWDAQAEL